MNNKKVKLGIIGCGVIGTYHLAGAQASSLIDITAVADLIKSKADKATETSGAKKVYYDGLDLLQDPEVEAVVLAFPANPRVPLVLEAMRRGKHVLIEKPVAPHASDVEEMLKLQGDKVAAVCSCRMRIPEAAKAATEFVATGRLGDIRLIRIKAVSPIGPKPESMPPDWRLRKDLNGGGILTNWGCYDLDYVLGITGWSLKPVSVMAQTWPISPAFKSYIPPESNAETHFSAFIKCNDGAVITIDRSEYAPGKVEGSWQIVGTNGTLYLDMIAEKEAKIIFDYATPESGVVSEVVWEYQEGPSTYDDGPITLYVPVQDFAGAILENRPPLTSLKEALVLAKITDAIYKSAERSGAVDLQ